MTGDDRSPRPSPLWAVAGVLAVVVVAWVAGSSGGRVGGPDTVPALPDSDPAPSGEVVLPRLDRIMDVEAFWRAMGGGDQAAVLDAIDPGPGTALSHYAAFATAFEAGFEPEGCRAIAANGVMCTLRATNADLIDLYWTRSEATGYVTSAVATFTDDGIDTFQMPTLVTSASIRLFLWARASGEVPAACDRVNYDALDLPPFSTAMAQTGACAEALLAMLPAALAAQRG